MWPPSPPGSVGGSCSCCAGHCRLSPFTSSSKLGGLSGAPTRGFCPVRTGMCGRTGRVLHKGSQPWGQRVPGPSCACAEEEGPVTNLYVAVDRPSAFGPFSLRPCLTTSTWEVLFCPRLSPESPLHTCLRLREFQLEDSEKRKAGRGARAGELPANSLVGRRGKGKVRRGLGGPWVGGAQSGRL